MQTLSRVLWTRNCDLGLSSQGVSGERVQMIGKFRDSSNWDGKRALSIAGGQIIQMGEFYQKISKETLNEMMNVDWRFRHEIWMGIGC
jgi:hypothetical protein